MLDIAFQHMFLIFICDELKSLWNVCHHIMHNIAEISRSDFNSYILKSVISEEGQLFARVGNGTADF